MPGRKYTSPDGYRYGFNGMENDDEVNKGSGNSIDFGARMYNPRLGIFFALDPLAPEYPHNSPYAFSENRVLDAIELEGLEAFPIHGTNHNSDVWTSELVLPTTNAIMSITNNTTMNTGFSWRVRSQETVIDRSGTARDRTDDLLNHQTNNFADRREAAGLLVNYILENMNGKEDITLIGYSHGGNVSTIAIDMLFEKHGIRANLITVNTPAFDGEGDSENPTGNLGINDMRAFWTPEDQVAGGISPGSNDHPPQANGVGATPRILVYPLQNRSVVSGLYSDHYLENVDPAEINRSQAVPLSPVQMTPITPTPFITPN